MGFKRRGCPTYATAKSVGNMMADHADRLIAKGAHPPDGALDQATAQVKALKEELARVREGIAIAREDLNYSLESLVSKALATEAERILRKDNMDALAMLCDLILHED